MVTASTNTTGKPIDGRDLWSGRVTIGWKPIQNLQTYLVWEHFQESDDRLRSAKQLCKTDYGPDTIRSPAVTMSMVCQKPLAWQGSIMASGDFFTQGCVPTSLYSPDAFQAPLSFALPYVLGLEILGRLPGNHRSLRQRGPIAQFAGDRIRDRADISRQQRYAGIQCRLQSDTGADAHVANRLQPAISCGRPKISTGSVRIRDFTIRYRSAIRNWAVRTG